MRLRHAAALALVGWYLMVPPASDWTKSEPTLVATKPSVGGADYGVFGFFSPRFSRWIKKGDFDSRMECDEARQHFKSRYGAEASRFPNKAKQDMADWASCISADDPRLKEK
jgi:hypothetical protein